MNDAKTIGSNALVLDTAEENVTVMNAEESKLGKEVSLIEQRAEAVVVASGADFEDAGLFLKQIKQAQKQVKDYAVKPAETSTSATRQNEGGKYHEQGLFSVPERRGFQQPVR